MRQFSIGIEVVHVTSSYLSVIGGNTYVAYSPILHRHRGTLMYVVHEVLLPPIWVPGGNTYVAYSPILYCSS